MRKIYFLLLLLIAGCGDSDSTIREKAFQAYRNKDYVNASTLFAKLARKGDAASQVMMGTLYHHGWGVALDKIEAMKWYALAAEQGNLAAISNLANGYKYGRGGNPPNYAEAVRWYEKCNQKPFSSCRTELGEMYEFGQGVPQDKAEAARQYKLGVDAASPGAVGNAELHLAKMYANGWGVQKDCQEAARLVASAARRSPVDADIARGLVRDSELRGNSCPGE